MVEGGGEEGRRRGREERKGGGEGCMDRGQGGWLGGGREGWMERWMEGGVRCRLARGLTSLYFLSLPCATDRSP